MKASEIKKWDESTQKDLESIDIPSWSIIMASHTFSVPRVADGFRSIKFSGFHDNGTDISGDFIAQKANGMFVYSPIIIDSSDWIDLDPWSGRAEMFDLVSKKIKEAIITLSSYLACTCGGNHLQKDHRLVIRNSKKGRKKGTA